MGRHLDSTRRSRVDGNGHTELRTGAPDGIPVLVIEMRQILANQGRIAWHDDPSVASLDATNDLGDGKVDVTDWRDKAGGTAAKLFEIIEKLPDWSPEAPASAFNAVRYSDAGKRRVADTAPRSVAVIGALRNRS